MNVSEKRKEEGRKRGRWKKGCMRKINKYLKNRKYASIIFKKKFNNVGVNRTPNARCLIMLD